MPKGSVTRNDLLLLIFNKVLPSYLGTLSGTGDVNITLALHTSDPGIGGSQSTNEANYGGYVRINAARTAGVWTVSGNQVSNTGLLQFAEATSGNNTITHLSAGMNSGQIIYSGALTASRSVSAGIQPQFSASSITVTES